MTKVSLLMTICGVLAVAGCTQTDGPVDVRNGPQTQSPIADAPGGKLPSGTGGVTRVIIDDSVPMSATPVAASPALAQTSASIFEFIR